MLFVFLLGGIILSVAITIYNYVRKQMTIEDKNVSTLQVFTIAGQAGAIFFENMTMLFLLDNKEHYALRHIIRTVPRAYCECLKSKINLYTSVLR